MMADGMEMTDQNAGFRFSAGSDHKAIGMRYLWLALFSVFAGMALSVLLRFGFVWPGADVGLLSHIGGIPERNGTLAALHGSLMVFFVLTAAPQCGFGSYFLPLQIGARETAFPKLNRLAFWGTAASFVVIGLSFFLADLALGLNLYVSGVVLFCAAGLVNAVNLAVTVIDLRGEGMLLTRLPLTVWAWFVNALLSSLIFSLLLAASTLLLSDRLAGTQFFPSLAGAAWSEVAGVTGAQALWQRLFWFFAEAQVYVAMLPCFGLVTHLLATFARRPVWKERLVVVALCAVGLCGFVVWGEHLFASGLNPYSPPPFTKLASSLGVPAIVLVLSWYAVLSKARIRRTTSALFALGFISLFLTGGLSGVLMAGSGLVRRVADADFVTGHLHLVMGIAATFALLAGLFFWFPKMFARRLNETAGKVHFWLTLVGVYAVFLPMHWIGLMARGGAVSGSVLETAHMVILVAMILTVAAQGIFFANLAWTLIGGDPVADWNPWRATTLEWSVPSPLPPDDSGAVAPAVYCGAYEFGIGSTDAQAAHEDSWPQHLALGEASGSLKKKGIEPDAR
jgi:cytochrome c oxidase subunit I